jgi:hypothetical protein
MKILWNITIQLYVQNTNSIIYKYKKHISKSYQKSILKIIENIRCYKNIYIYIYIKETLLIFL